jgi:hypothetical protein
VPNVTQAVEDQRVDLPLDMIDAAARICEPIFTGVTSDSPQFGKFLKDYVAVSW